MTLFRSLIRAVSRIDFFTNAEYTRRISPRMRIENAMSLTNNYFAETQIPACSVPSFGILDTSGIPHLQQRWAYAPSIISQNGIKQI
jgi:hypothetical protein